MSVGRYADSARATWTAPDGRAVTYLQRRLLPAAGRFVTARLHEVRAGERVDMLAAAELGDAELSWLVADANLAMRPRELEQPGRILSIPESRA